MQLVRCPDCNRKISTKAEACPACGRPITDKDKAKFARLLEGRERREEKFAKTLNYIGLAVILYFVWDSINPTAKLVIGTLVSWIVFCFGALAFASTYKTPPYKFEGIVFSLAAAVSAGLTYFMIWHVRLAPLVVVGAAVLWSYLFLRLVEFATKLIPDEKLDKQELALLIGLVVAVTATVLTFYGVEAVRACC